VLVAPQIFDQDDRGLVILLDRNAAAELHDAARKAAKLCPAARDHDRGTRRMTARRDPTPLARHVAAARRPKKASEQLADEILGYIVDRKPRAGNASRAGAADARGHRPGARDVA
jgi:hypothetical protein